MDRIVKPIFVILLWVCCAIVISVLSSAATFFVIGGNDIAHIHISGIIANLFFLLGFWAQVRKSVDSPPGMLTEDHHHTVHEESQVCYSSHLRPKSLHL